MSLSPLVRLRIDGPLHDLGDGVFVRRVLPSPQRLAVGPFILLDHLGPLTLPACRAFDVRPHPHIGLSTLTYLWEGRVEHRDGLGVTQLIEPGAVNLMSAGSGIVHSERTAAEDRGAAQAMHGLQIWLVPPRPLQEAPPAFSHTPADALPDLDPPAAVGGPTGRPRLKLVAGTAFDACSPVPVDSALFYIDARMPAGSSVPLPLEHAQRAVYVVDGAVACGPAAGTAGSDVAIRAGQMVLFTPDVPVRLTATEATHLVMLGGEPIDGPRHIWWNFASSSAQRIDVARQRWRKLHWPMVAGDTEFIPLPAPHERQIVTVTGDWA